MNLDNYQDVDSLPGLKGETWGTRRNNAHECGTWPDRRLCR
jgi:hypothetical protein